MRARSRPALGLLLICGGVGACTVIPPGGARSPEQQVRAVEERWLAGVSDPEVVGPLLAADFEHVLPGGTITREQHLQYLREHPGAFPGAKHFEELRVRVYGQTAVATGIVSTDRGSGSEPRRTAFTDVFVQRAGRWLAVSAQELPLTATR